MLRNLFFIFFICCQLILASTVNAAADSSEEKKPITNSALDQSGFYNIVTAAILATSKDSGQLEQAADMLFKQAKQDRDEKLFEKAALASLASGNHKKTNSILNSWQKNYPDTKLQYLIRIQLYQATAQPKKLIGPTRWLLQHQDSSAERNKAITDIPYLFANLPNKEQAVESVKKVLVGYFDSNDEQAVAAWSSLAYMQLQARQYDAMLASLKQAFSIPIADHTPPLRVAAQRLNNVSKAKSLQPKDITGIWQLLQQHFDGKDIAPVTRLNYAETLLRQQQDFSAAKKQLLTIVQLPFPSIDFPRNQENLATITQANFLLGSLYANQSSFILAKSYALTANRLIGSISANENSDSEQQLRILLLLANIEQLTGNFADAKTWLDKITPKQQQQHNDLIASNFSRMAKAAYQLSGILFQDGNSNAVALEPILLLPANNLDEKLIQASLVINFYSSSQQYQLAYQSIDQARQELQPDNPDLLFEQSILAHYSGNSQQIEPLLQQLLQLEPDNAQALNNLGYHLLSNPERLDEAIAYIEQAVELSPNEPNFLDSLGYAYLKKNQLERAIELLQQAHQQQKNPEIAAHLVEALWRNQQHEQAREIWHESYQLFPNAAELKAVAQEFFTINPPN